jgi:4-carboxymuconolactone decarboxylase
MQETTAADGEGIKTFLEVMGDRATPALDAMRAQSPELTDWVTSFIFGTVYAREDLDRHQQQMITIAALTTLGASERQLELHVAGALNVGLTPRDIVSVILHVAPYSGFPRALNAMAAAKHVIDEAS